MEGDCSQLDIVLGESSHRGSVGDLSQNALKQNQDCVHNLPRTEYNNAERGKNSMSEDASKNQRVKWVDKMAKLMITALSYLGEDSGFKSSVLQKKGKWKLVSKAMIERGYRVSPQQCEDKFNELNKRYKKLNEMLGRGTSCEVVENPVLLEKIEYLNEKEKDVVRRIMSSKQLFYEEMCSYNNGNRLHLPHDFALQRALHLMLRSCDDTDNDEDESDEYEERHSSKRSRRSKSHEDVGHSNNVSSRECNKSYVPQLSLCQAVVNRKMSLESGKAASLQKKRIESKRLELEERKLHIQAELMELERQRFKWEIFSKKRDHKLETMRMENEKMRLENERMTLELKRAELSVKTVTD